MAQRGRILIVDDEANARAALSEILREEGYATETAADGFKALGKLEEFAPGRHPDRPEDAGPRRHRVHGESAQRRRPGAVFVVMTAFGTISSAVEAMKKGAENYLLKPLDPEALGAVVERAMEKARLVQEARRLRDRLRERNAFSHIVSADPKMHAVLELVAQVGPSKASVLVTGESGTGKELIAEAIHLASPRARKAPFVRLHCAALSESLLESELFGHERGAFTGAVGRREGRFKQADGGTLFLDEIGEISPAVQVKLLRFLQEKTFERVGGNETLKVDVRIIAATNRDLAAEIKRGRVPRGPLLSAQRRHRRAAAAARAAGRHPRARELLLAPVRGRERQDDRDVRRRRARDAARVPLARQRARARERHRARRRPLRRPQHREEAPAAERRARRRSATGSRRSPARRSRSSSATPSCKTLEACGGSTSKAATVLGVSPRKIQYKLHEYARPEARDRRTP